MFALPGFVAFCTLALPNPTQAEPLPTLTIGPHLFERCRLSNGLAVLVARDADPEVSVFLVIGAGRRQESALTTGLAHLTEHAMYTGTAKTPAGGHDRRIHELGAESNAFTRDDYTLFYDHQVPLAALDEVLAMEADRLRNLVFDEAAVLHERERLSDEEARTFTPAQALDELVENCMFRNHPYGAGLLDARGHTLAPRLPVAAIREFYDTWYHPERCAVVIAGAVDPAAALQAVERAFGSLPKGPPAPPMPEEPSQLLHSEHHFASELSRDRVERVWRIPAHGSAVRIPLAVLARWIQRQSQSDGTPFEAHLGDRVDSDLFRIVAHGEHAAEDLQRIEGSIRAAAYGADQIAQIKELIQDDFETLPLRGRPYFALAGQVGVYAALGHAEYPAQYQSLVEAVTSESIAVAIDEALPAALAHRVVFHGSQKPSTPLPDDPRLLAQEAETAESSGDLERAIAAYSMLLAGKPNRMNTVIYLATRGQLRVRQKDYAAAIADYEQALSVVDYPAVRDLLDEARKLSASDLRSEPSGGTDPQQRDAATPQTTPAPAPPTPAASATIADTIAQLEAELPGIQKELAAWRGLEFLDPVRFEVVEPGENSLAGWYEPETKRLFVVHKNTARFQRGTLLHECFHALQDQHFDLNSLHREAGTDRDAQRALTALIEGEAMLAVAEIMHYDFEQHTHLPERGAIDPERFEKIFHYGAGLRFVRTLRDQKGWPAVATLYRQPPRTTAEILHPGRYPLRKLATPALAPPAGEGSLDRKGEYELLWCLTRDERTRANAAQSAALLIGDRYFTRSAPDDRPLEAIWDLAFADASIAEEFLDKNAPALPGRATRTGATVRIEIAQVGQ